VEYSEQMSDRLVEALATLKALSRARQDLEHGTPQYEYALEQETRQTELVRALVQAEESGFEVAGVR